jgi:hypothetical protein
VEFILHARSFRLYMCVSSAGLVAAGAGIGRVIVRAGYGLLTHC